MPEPSPVSSSMIEPVPYFARTVIISSEQKPREIGSDVFVSYKREDRNRILLIISALRELDLTVWLDAALEAGETFDEEIARELSRARSHLICWTSASVSSRWVRAEAHIGAGRNILVPIFLEPCTPFPPFNLDHTVSLADWEGQLDHTEWRQVLTRIGGLLGRGSALSRWTHVASTRDVSDLRAFIRDFPADALVPKARRLAFQMQLKVARSNLLKEFSLSEDEAEENSLPEAEVQLNELIQTLNRERLQHADELSKCKSRLRQAEDDYSKTQASLITAKANILQSQEVLQSHRESARTALMKLEKEFSRGSSLELELSSAKAKLLELETTVAKLQDETAASRTTQIRPEYPEHKQSHESSKSRARDISSSARATASNIKSPNTQETQKFPRDSKEKILTVLLFFIAIILYLGKDIFLKL